MRTTGLSDTEIAAERLGTQSDAEPCDAVIARTRDAELARTRYNELRDNEQSSAEVVAVMLETSRYHEQRDGKLARTCLADRSSAFASSGTSETS